MIRVLQLSRIQFEGMQHQCCYGTSCTTEDHDDHEVALTNRETRVLDSGHCTLSACACRCPMGKKKTLERSGVDRDRGGSWVRSLCGSAIQGEKSPPFNVGEEAAL